MNIWTNILQPLFYAIVDAASVLKSTLFLPVDMSWVNDTFGSLGVDIASGWFPSDVPLIVLVLVTLIPIILVASIIRIFLLR